VNIYLNTWLLGDTVCAINVIEELAKNNEINLKLEKPQFSFFFESMNNVVLKESLGSIDIELSPHQFFAEGDEQGYHMVQGYFKQAGLPMPNDTRPHIVFNSNIQNKDMNTIYEYIISPYSRSDLDNNKLWPYENWQKIINFLKGNRIALFGTSEDEKVFTGVHYLFDKPLNDVCYVLSKVKKAVLSIDNGPSHIVHGIGAPHILLYPACLNKNWVTNSNSNAKIIRGEPKNITVDSVINLIKKHYP
jgi:ADP-heptose:LPS heptosyltransferase